jgi:hypothetical protein
MTAKQTAGNSLISSGPKIFKKACGLKAARNKVERRYRLLANLMCRTKFGNLTKLYIYDRSKKFGERQSEKILSKKMLW